MRSLGLAPVVVAFGLFTPPASAAVIEFDHHFCGCDPSSGDEDTRTLVVKAAAGELNRMSVRRSPRGVVIDDLGAPLAGECRPARAGGRFCRGDDFDGVQVELGDGDDELGVVGVGGTVDGGAGDDRIAVAGPPHQLTGGPGADLLDSRLAPGSSVSYLAHTEGVTVSVNGVADDGAPGEGDNVLGAIGTIQGGAGDDVLDTGETVTALLGEGGNDTLVGGPRADYVVGGDGDDTIATGDGDDRILGGAGADVLGGGLGRDEVSYASANVPLRLSIGDGPDDGAAGEGDAILADVEDLIGGPGTDVIIGDDDANRLVSNGGADVLAGRGGADRLEGYNQGAELDAGPGVDTVLSGERDRPLLVDGERDRTFCGGRAPVVRADSFDSFDSCAPRVDMRRLRVGRRGAPMRVDVRCATPSAVPCQGRIEVHLVRRQKVIRTVRFGPIRPGRRGRVTIPLRARPGAVNCFIGVAVTRRHDNLRSVTRSRSALGCVPR